MATEAELEEIATSEVILTEKMLCIAQVTGIGELGGLLESLGFHDGGIVFNVYVYKEDDDYQNTRFTVEVAEYLWYH